MKTYETVTEAIEIVRTTYKGREYAMGVYESDGDKDKLVDTITGDAVHIYDEQLSHDMKEDGLTLWPTDDNDVEGMALMETIYAVPMHRAPACGFEISARDFLNSIIEEAKKA